jgi:hypothetical protein
MADQDWRLRVRLAEDDRGLHLVEGLHGAELGRTAKERLGGRIAVSRDGPEVFLYANTEEAGREAERVVRAELEREGWDAQIALDRWHPVEERWEDAALPLPETDQERDAEHAELMAQEAREAEEGGYGEFEVRVDLPSWQAATDLSRRLDEEKLPHVRRWRYVLLGAVNEDVANELADRMRKEAPSEAEISVEGAFAAAQSEQPLKAFAVFGL